MIDFIYLISLEQQRQFNDNKQEFSDTETVPFKGIGEGNIIEEAVVDDLSLSSGYY